MNITRKQVYLSIFALIIVLLLIWGFLPSAVPVSVEEARIAPLEVTIEEEGKTRVIDRYTISAPVTGYLMRLDYEVGDSVRAGQELFAMQPVPDLISTRQSEVAKAQMEAARTRRMQALEQLALANEEKRLAETELLRLQNLFEDGIGSRQMLDHAELAAKRTASQQASAEFAVKIAEHEIRAAESALQAFQSAGREERISIPAPVDGRLLKILQKSEGSVQAGTPILEIGDPRSLELRIDLLSTDAVTLMKGTPVRIKRWGSEKNLDGLVKLIEPSGYTRISALGVEEQRVPVIVEIVTPYEEWRVLGDGFRVVAEFITWKGEEILQVPSSSLFRTAEAEWALFMVESGDSKLRRVEIGRQSGLYTQIVSGLEAGDQIITHPDERIEDGVKVRLIGRE
jgi:HlyD family secretion protein